MNGRIVAEGGSFLEGVPTGCDVYLLVRVLHDWKDEDCLRILRACRAAMKTNAVLLVCEEILEPDPARGSPATYLVDMQMMAMFGSARERTEVEFRYPLRSSGFAIQGIASSNSTVSVVEAVAAPDLSQ
jgi:O-methyltransferase domain